MWRCNKCNGEVVFNVDEVVSYSYTIDKDMKRQKVKNSTPVDELGDYFKCTECGERTAYDEYETPEAIATWKDEEEIFKLLRGGR